MPTNGSNSANKEKDDEAKKIVVEKTSSPTNVDSAVRTFLKPKVPLEYGESKAECIRRENLLQRLSEYRLQAPDENIVES